MALYNTYSDGELTELLRASDRGAFTELYNRYWKLLFAVAAHKLNSLPDAEEIVQETFVDLWQRRESLQITTSLKAYLAAAVRYQSWTLMARQLREKRNRQQFTQARSAPYPTPAQALDAKDLFAQLQQRINILPERCLLVYQLSRVEGFSNKEIAAQLQVTEKAVERQITRALRHVRTGLECITLLLFSGL